jgi:hypothetical protein
MWFPYSDDAHLGLSGLVSCSLTMSAHSFYDTLHRAPFPSASMGVVPRSLALQSLCSTQGCKAELMTAMGSDRAYLDLSNFFYHFPRPRPFQHVTLASLSLLFSTFEGKLLI